MNTRTKSRDELRMVFKKNSIQSYYGATYLNHLIEPYYRNHGSNNFLIPYITLKLYFNYRLIYRIKISQKLLAKNLKLEKVFFLPLFNTSS